MFKWWDQPCLNIYIVLLSDKSIFYLKHCFIGIGNIVKKEDAFQIIINFVIQFILDFTNKSIFFLTHSPLLHRHGVVRFKMHSYCYDVLFFQQICGVQHVYCLINFWYVEFFIDLKWNLEKMQTDHIERFIRESCFKSWWNFKCL